MSTPDLDVLPRRRDGSRTRELLLISARRRFAQAGYAATTVRDIADDVGINVSLINRYFGSKGGLFQACLSAAVEEFARAGSVTSVAEIPQALAQRLIGATSTDSRSEILPLLLRSSGDPDADSRRVAVLTSFSQQIAATAPPIPGRSSSEMLLRAELVLAIAIGAGVLRSMPGLEPLASVTDHDLAEALTAVIDALLAPGDVVT